MAIEVKELQKFLSLFLMKKVIHEFTSLVNPEQNTSPFITNLTGISNAMVRTAPKFYEIAKKVQKLIKDKIFVAHNVNFNCNIIQQEFKDLGFDFIRKKLCTVRLSRKIILVLKSYSLGNICSAEGIQIADRHRAKGDAEAIVELFKRLIEREDEFILHSLLNNRSRQASLPPLIDNLTVDNLPENLIFIILKTCRKRLFM